MTDFVQIQRLSSNLERAVKHEEKNQGKEYYLGWEWSDVRAYPAELMKLVREGIVDIEYKSRRYTNYKLADRECTVSMLESCPRDALEMTTVYELATSDRKAMDWVVDMETE